MRFRLFQYALPAPMESMRVAPRRRADCGTHKTPPGSWS